MAKRFEVNGVVMTEKQFVAKSQKLQKELLRLSHRLDIVSAQTRGAEDKERVIVLQLQNKVDETKEFVRNVNISYV